ncbi:hypothetical protein KL949_003758 [Ogataea haglerorum]|nr:hypothetical protein KL913_003780 [Ogataea haglerorum]KAG7716467.1 hypothetical protein KL949_003758 [Ogataea haglerorum]KAG7765649.1 hypothetical protein KL931_004300 [Ogataea haglerorum]
MRRALSWDATGALDLRVLCAAELAAVVLRRPEPILLPRRGRMVRAGDFSRQGAYADDFGLPRLIQALNQGRRTVSRSVGWIVQLSEVRKTEFGRYVAQLVSRGQDEEAVRGVLRLLGTEYEFLHTAATLDVICRYLYDCGRWRDVVAMLDLYSRWRKTPAVGTYNRAIAAKRQLCQCDEDDFESWVFERLRVQRLPPDADTFLLVFEKLSTLDGRLACLGTMMFKQIDIESLVGPVVAQVAEKLGGSRIGKKFLYPSCLRVHFSMLFLPRLLEHSGPQTAFRFMDWAQTPPSPRLVRAFVLFFLRRQPCEIWNAVAAINYFRTHYGYRCDAKYDKQLAFKPLYNAARERQLDVRVLKVLYRESFWRDRDGVVRCAVKESRLDRAVAEPLSESDRAWAQDVMDICWPVDQAGSPLVDRPGQPFLAKARYFGHSA